MAWEIGGGLGHVVPLLTLARLFKSRGHTPVFALKNIVEPSFLFRDEDFPILQAPVWPEDQYRRKVPPTRDFADILAFHGLADIRRTLAMVKAWKDLVEIVRPDVIVADYCPALCMAVRGRVPVMAMGSGFSLPPADLETFPALLPEVRPLIDRNRFLDRLNQVQRIVGAPELPALSALLDTEARFVMCLPAFDPYAAYRAVPADGPLDPLLQFAPLPQQRRIFVYLGVEVISLRAVFEGLKRIGQPVTAYVRGASPRLQKELAGPGIEISDQPVPYTQVLPRCSLVVHPGSLGTATACLAAGRPQVIVPAHMEHRLNTRSLVERNAGLLLEKRFDGDYFAAAAGKVLDAPAMADSAKTLALELDRTAYIDVPGRMVDRALALVGG